jgi:hypothetical protein
LRWLLWPSIINNISLFLISGTKPTDIHLSTPKIWVHNRSRVRL